ncbi:MAG: helix-turn-helix domain-containing protein [Fimbriimonadaceae bacterium]|nr:MAG: helix-turn-helix domain-containing protein [Fimbriimonadaceae bacterium]
MDHLKKKSSSNDLNPIHLLRVDEVAKILSIGRSKAYELVASGSIPAIRITDRILRVRSDDLSNWLEAQKQK